MEKDEKILRRNIEAGMKEMQLNKLQLSKKAGLNESAIRDILSGRSKSPRFSTLQAIAKVFKCGVDDLFYENQISDLRDLHTTGDDIIKEANHKMLTVKEKIQCMQKAMEDSPEVNKNFFIDELSVSPSAGAAAFEESDGTDIVNRWQIPRDFIRQYTNAPAEMIKIIRAQGDSMAPLINSGDPVFVDTTNQTPSPPGIFVLWDGMGLVMKQCEIIPNTDPVRVKIKSANTSYAEYERDMSEVYINGRVIGRWQWM